MPMAYQDHSVEIARLDKEIERLEDIGGDDTRLRILRKQIQRLHRLQAIWDKKQKWPRLFAQMRAAVDSPRQEAQELVRALLDEN